MAAAYAAGAGLGLLAVLDLAAVRAHVLDLQAEAAVRLAAQGERVRLLDRPARGSHIGLLEDDPPAPGRALVERGIAISPRGEAVRLSHRYSSTDDVPALCEALDDLRRRRPTASGITSDVTGRSGVHR